MVISAHQMALNPTRSQERLLWEHVGYARFAANRAIEGFQDGLADGQWRNDKKLRPRWNARTVRLLLRLLISARTRPRTPCAMSAGQYPGGEITGVL